jgi:hypothetical protein
MGIVISLEMIRLRNWQGRDLDLLFVDQSHVYTEKHNRLGHTKNKLVLQAIEND